MLLSAAVKGLHTNQPTSERTTDRPTDRVPLYTFAPGGGSVTETTSRSKTEVRARLAYLFSPAELYSGTYDARQSDMKST